MGLYEHVFIARQDVTQAQADELKNHFVQVVNDNGAQVSRQEYWGLRNLAYKIDKNRKGHYFLMNITGDSKAIQELERQERLHDDVIRYLTVKVETQDENPSVMMQPASEQQV